MAKRPLRVAMLTTYYPRHERDHAGLFVADLVKQLENRGVEVTVLRPGVYKDYGLAYGDGIVANAKRRPWLVPLMLGSMLRALRRAAQSADLVHVHWLMAAPLGLLSGRPWVVTLHGTPTARSLEDLNLLTRWRWIVGPVLRRARCVICVSQVLTEKVAELGASAVWIPNGVTIPESVEEEAKPLEVLYAGRMVEEKGIRELAAIADQLNLVVAGDGPLRHLLPQALGFVPHDELEVLYDRAALLVVPSHSEGQGVVCLEAMAHARPVVASDVGGLSELVDDGITGYLVPPRDPERLLEAVCKLLRDKEDRRKMGSMGREKVARLCGWETVAARTLSAYAGAAATSGLAKGS